MRQLTVAAIATGLMCCIAAVQVFDFLQSRENAAFIEHSGMLPVLAMERRELIWFVASFPAVILVLAVVHLVQSSNELQIPMSGLAVFAGFRGIVVLWCLAHVPFLQGTPGYGNTQETRRAVFRKMQEGFRENLAPWKSMGFGDVVEHELESWEKRFMQPPFEPPISVLYLWHGPHRERPKLPARSDPEKGVH
jgi:hypothetical protein